MDEFNASVNCFIYDYLNKIFVQWVWWKNFITSMMQFIVLMMKHSKIFLTDANQILFVGVPIDYRTYCRQEMMLGPMILALEMEMTGSNSGNLQVRLLKQLQRQKHSRTSAQPWTTLQIHQKSCLLKAITHETVGAPPHVIMKTPSGRPVTSNSSKAEFFQILCLCVWTNCPSNEP